MTPTQDQILRSHARDYAESFNRDSPALTRNRARLIEYVMGIYGYTMNHKGEYENDKSRRHPGSYQYPDQR